jgi:NTE family protein
MQKKFTLIFIGIVFSLTAFAQRPKIGLTLSGGGAKGLVHIGILQALDSAGLKVDYITGTSMGSVVGGLYAAGYSGDTIETIARELDWDLLFSPSPQLDLISIEEKDEYNKYAIEIPFQKGKFKIGKGIIEGQELWLKFSELFLPVYNIHDFNKLPIPFACIGTDLSTGDAIVINKGNIISAIRASMAIPSVFTPVDINGKTLVDGGVVNNFPVLDVKKMGADYVIGVNLSKGLDKAEDLETMFDVLLQLAFLKDAITFEEHKAACDIYILPELTGYGTGDFSYSDSIIDIGKQLGDVYYPVFKQLADSLNTLYPPNKPFVKNRLPKTKKIVIEKYSVTGLKNTSENFFFGLSGLQSEKNYSYEKVSESIHHIYGSRYYKKIQYDFLPSDSGKTEMKFIVEENPLAAIKFALNYNDYTKLSLIGNITIRDFLLKESRASATVSLSENPRLYFEYYKYLGKFRKLGINTSFYRESVDFPAYIDFELYETLRHSLTSFDVRAQYNLTRKMYVGLAQQYNTSVIKTKESPEVIFDGRNEFWHTYATFRYSSRDKKNFTTRGLRIRADFGFIYDQIGEVSVMNKAGDFYNADSLGLNFQDMYRLNFKIEHFSPLTNRFVLLKAATVSYLHTKTPYLPNSFQVGGVADNIANQVQFAGLNESEIKTGSIATGMLGIQYRVAGSVYLIGRANVGIYNFYKMDIDDFDSDNNLLTGESLTAGVMTPIGPIEISAMHCEQDGKIRASLNLGYRF